MTMAGGATTPGRRKALGTDVATNTGESFLWHCAWLRRSSSYPMSRFTLRLPLWGL